MYHRLNLNLKTAIKIEFIPWTYFENIPLDKDFWSYRLLIKFASNITKYPRNLLNKK